MAHVPALPASTSLVRKQLSECGGETAARCYQCATCSSVCQLAPAHAPFPRKQMLLAQWGMIDELAGDPAIWLCHQCNDCSVRCPRDAKPGDVLQSLRNLATRRLAVPGFMGTLVANAGKTWPLLIGLPIVYWVALIYIANGLTIPHDGPLVYDQFVPHWTIYGTYFTVTGLVVLFSAISGMRYWSLMGTHQARAGSFVSHLIPVLIEIMTHKRFDSCGETKPRRWGHLALFWGFVGAAVTSGFIIIYMYIEGKPLPVPLSHPYKVLGNISAVSLFFGGLWLLINRLSGERTGKSTAFDNFFLAIVLALIGTGILVEIGRFVFDPMLACYLYLLHLGVVLCLFATFPYSKFAHMLFRTLAMVHERMAAQKAEE